ncbi:hypothetical protein AALP_AA7G208100 [Arabis alpina]|uniref:protein-serine/threonine phosphatase n=1 Tax=Arabis alpina TaxID=50452 RepID=A0A087GJH3_ARAAL|nr:hypothetical protein AALP_AA7G208100 [Arabis alpina]
MTEASSSKGACEHSVVVYNLCVQCGAIVEGTGVSLPYIHKNIRMNQDEISRLGDSDMRALQRQRKLCLVLDLDHTLLNTTFLIDMREDEEYLRSYADSFQDVSAGNLFMLESMMTKLRPFVHSFLKEVIRHQKSLDVVLGKESSVLILDDTKDMWPKHKDNLIVIERYQFFASSCKQYGYKYQSRSLMKSDESEPDGDSIERNA